MTLTKELKEKLTSRFDESEIKFKPAAIKEGKALALPYVDARTILDRLDEVIGSENWHDEYAVIAPNQVICKLTIYGTTKSDAGEAANDDKEPLKSAVSDALKRAAVKFGVGRYLYKMPKMWCKFDNRKNEFVEKPILNEIKSGQVSLNQDSTKAEDPIAAECSSCGEKITNRVAIFSKKYYEKPLCMKCQNEQLK